jgi:hypothetical protein
MNCPGTIPIKEVIDFADGKINFAKYIVHDSKNGKFNA